MDEAGDVRRDREGQTVCDRKTGRQTERERQRDKERDRDRNRQRESSNSGTLFYKDCSLASVKT